MLIRQGERYYLSQFLSFLLSGEVVAHRCAAKQASLCDDSHTRKFLRRQSHQEKFHAMVFSSAILWLTPKGSSNPARVQMQRYEDLLCQSLDDHDLPSSIIGLQIILEGMADIALSRLNHAFEKRGDSFRKIRRAILQQEESHHDFGLRYTSALDPESPAFIKSEAYISQVHDMLVALQPLFDIFEEDDQSYLDEFTRKLPDVILTHAIYHNSSI